VNPSQTTALQQLVHDTRVAALGTLHDGEPAVSMVPFAALPDGSLVLHVSDMSAHTRDMLQAPAVSLLITAPDTGERPAQALPRVTLQGRAEPLTGAAEEAARGVYLGRFPEAEEIAAIPGFSFFAVRPVSVRFIAGFAQAITLTPDAFAAALRA
jgi:putative heme iron utilization protein